MTTKEEFYLLICPAIPCAAHNDGRSAGQKNAESVMERLREGVMTNVEGSVDLNSLTKDREMVGGCLLSTIVAMEQVDQVDQTITSVPKFTS